MGQGCVVRSVANPGEPLTSLSPCGKERNAPSRSPLRHKDLPCTSSPVHKTPHHLRLMLPSPLRPSLAPFPSRPPCWSYSHSLSLFPAVAKVLQFPLFPKIYPSLYTIPFSVSPSSLLHFQSCSLLLASPSWPGLFAHSLRSQVKGEGRQQLTF